jgi:hypothetical protein
VGPSWAVAEAETLPPVGVVEVLLCRVVLKPVFATVLWSPLVASSIKDLALVTGREALLQRGVQGVLGLVTGARDSGSRLKLGSDKVLL